MAASGCKSCCKSCCWDPVKGCIDAVLENKLVKDIRLVVTLFMAVTSYVAVFKEFDQKFIDRKLDLSFSPPDDRCVPYFDKAEQLVQGQEPNSILYSYVDGEPQVLCAHGCRCRRIVVAVLCWPSVPWPLSALRLASVPCGPWGGCYDSGRPRTCDPVCVRVRYAAGSAVHQQNRGRGGRVVGCRQPLRLAERSHERELLVRV